MGLSPTHILILAVIAALLFGGGRFSHIMTDVAKGVKGFKKSMAEDDETPPSLAISTSEHTPHRSTVDRPA